MTRFVLFKTKKGVMYREIAAVYDTWDECQQIELSQVMGDTSYRYYLREYRQGECLKVYHWLASERVWRVNEKAKVQKRYQVHF